MSVPVGPRPLSLETERFGTARKMSQTVTGKGKNEKRRESELSAFSVNWTVPVTRTGMSQLPE
jgi:hypothetical protein